MASLSDKMRAYDAAHLILGDYLQYHYRFKGITKRAKHRFEQRDWKAILSDSTERGILYRDMVGATTGKLLAFLGDYRHNRSLWRDIKHLFLEEISNFNTRNIAETYYNSVFRHSHKGLSIDEDLMFVQGVGNYRDFRSSVPMYYTFFLFRPLEPIIRQILSCFPFDAPMQDGERDIQYMVTVLNHFLEKEHPSFHNGRIEIIKSLFYRNRSAYMVGRICIDEAIHPFVVPIVHEETGIYLDCLLLTNNDVTSIFSYNRSYFLVDTEIATEMVDFLRTFMPLKSRGELYNSLGFEKHGKTVFYRDFIRHLDMTEDQFIIAPGIKGMVMSVFTLPSYNMVFKIIKDRFTPPKYVSEAEVKSKYELVSRHDRIGRMADSHMFEHFAIARDRFSDELLEELLEVAPSKVLLINNQVIIKHMYIEKRMIPLNLYLDRVNDEDAREAMNEYGKAIKQLAAVNIFPGDMLLKNFGVTRLKRVVFYDYDEITYITDMNFRKIPKARHDDDEYSQEPWFDVGAMDVFPEEFPKFLVGNPKVKEMLFEFHADLFDVHFWQNMQTTLRAGQYIRILPYRRRLRFKNLWRSGSFVPASERS